MVESPGVYVPFAAAEATRRQLANDGLLRTDLHVRKEPDGVVFPTTQGPVQFDFEPRHDRPRQYTDLLDWPAAELANAPRAFDTLGDIIVVKIPLALGPRENEVGAALLAFHGARAVFHDKGVTGELRTRDLVRIAGEGGSETTVQENGVRLTVDPAAAYFSPRLADERARITGLARPGERVIDLFGGVAPQGIQLAKGGADVVSVDLNPAGARLARVNAEQNKVVLDVREGDARTVARTLAPADRVIMNLPHGAKEFLDVGSALVRPGGMLHHHEIMAIDALPSRSRELIAAFAALERPARIVTTRHVRAYSSKEAHYVFDVELA